MVCMWRRLRKFILILVTVSAGLLAGVLIRFGFGHGLQWESAVDKPAVIPVRVPGIEGKAPADSAELPPAASAGSDPVLVRLRAIAGISCHNQGKSAHGRPPDRAGARVGAATPE